jgi:hypothetical protein
LVKYADFEVQLRSREGGPGEAPFVASYRVTLHEWTGRDAVIEDEPSGGSGASRDEAMAGALSRAGKVIDREYEERNRRDNPATGGGDW